ncbi:hypothetical protein [Streptosporangium sp. CA-115845]|uniref:hypothetical protein n=1 Tax=Streptosporangium sp. CA-115845 TaxID=3240071 RepID=UPI003D90677A
MSYSVSAYGPDDGSDEPRELYEAALGSNGTITHYWLKQAQLIKLPILARLRHEELLVKHEELAAFSKELRSLSIRWVEMVPDDEIIMYQIGSRTFRVPLLVDLLHRAAHLDAAIRIAQLTGGYLDIY